MTNTISDKPSPSVLEVTVLGPGYGESVVIHLGCDKWVVIDCCVDDDNNPAPISYLEKIGVPLEHVLYVIVTHWHDDHIKAISELYRRCTNAKVCISNVFSRQEFLQYIAAMNKQNPGDMHTSGVSEMSKLMESIKNRNADVKFANADRLIFRTDEASHNSKIECWSLSPSDASIGRFLNDISVQAPVEKQTKRRASSISPNDASVAIYLKINNKHAILLGADLEETPHKGWTNVLACETSFDAKAKVFKVPHHGSKNAHHNDVWSTLLDNQPISILTPWNRGRKLPTQEDVNRITSLTEHAYSTKKLSESNKTQRKRSGNIQKIINKTTGTIVKITNSAGIVRNRLDLNDESEWKTELFDGACHLSKALT